MCDDPPFEPGKQIEDLYQTESRRIFATLVRLVRDFDHAEEAMHEAFAAALEQWSESGIPQNPVSWLVSTGRFKAIDIIRRRKLFAEKQTEVIARIEAIDESNTVQSQREIADDTLRLIFTCCHPAIDPTIQVPLTLREVCGMTTEEIASAFLTKPATMAQRIVRGKAKIRDANIPYIIPQLSDLPERLDAVLSVIYLVFNEGYSASAGETLTRTDLSNEAIRLARQLFELLPDPEVAGLLALMLLHESRRKARQTLTGDIILLEDQDRTLWNRDLITEGNQLVEQSLSSGRFGIYTIQAAISAVHANAETSAETDWTQIVALYDVLLRANSSPVIELNRAVAIAMRDGAEAGLKIIDTILNRGELNSYYLAHSARGELLRRLHQFSKAKDAFALALSLAKQETDRRFLTRKLQELEKTS
ncbi:RNA polymerase sigma factor [Rubinisphaera sp.]|uniref:RNA polymerase sigma factor n=1 Tax=Rubinisphaera sp. TaxID=2024857 RepID=UPI000C117225|nr:RNA polymerase sigma factor [Rubinisphaera sp.]MBV08017.1 RNA polymerase subunit sigma-24 [Rubinisphaera sp.]HCS53483.1 RNA polymerase subunit sigma-24 [Planctomycetaceae bacterium]|tara:strand:- start:2327 stop:3586 length:1260 start_codon:yes stop_codon:yes gene_type:complete